MSQGVGTTEGDVVVSQSSGTTEDGVVTTEGTSVESGAGGFAPSEASENAHPKAARKRTSFSDLVLWQHSGEPLNICPACVDKSNKYLFCSALDVVKVYSVTTGLQIAELVHDSLVIGLHLNPLNCFQLFTCTIQGEIIQWDYTDCVKLKSWKPLQSEIVGLFFVTDPPENRWYLCAQDKDEVWSLYAVTAEKDNARVNRVLRKVPPYYNELVISRTNNFAAFIRGDILDVKDLQDRRRVIQHTIPPPRKYTCIACHPTEEVLCTGECGGRILLWRNIFARYPVRTNFHWHPRPVVSLAFSSEGSVLFSGGEEHVIVKWPLNFSYVERNREFIPRLGATVLWLSLSPDSSTIAACLSDNSIVIASNHMRILQRIYGLIRRSDIYLGKLKDNTAASLFPVGMQYDYFGCGGYRTLGSLILNGHLGHLFFYDFKRRNLRFSLDVVDRNQPPVEDETIICTDVCRVAMMRGWLATVEYRPPAAYAGEVKLKFWKWNTEKSNFELKTGVDYPHLEFNPVILFRPGQTQLREPHLVSAGRDGKVKDWRLSRIDKSESWTCGRVCFYQEQAAHCVCFNDAGKLIGIAFGKTLTVWRFSTLGLLRKLVLADEAEPRHMLFGSRREKLFVVFATDSYVASWNLPRRYLMWKVKTDISSIVRDPDSGIFAAFDNEYLSLFCASSPKPFLLRPHSDMNGPVSCATFVPALDVQRRIHMISKLVYLDTEQNLMCLSTNKEMVAKQEFDKMPSDLVQTNLLSSLLIGKTVQPVKSKAKPFVLENKSNVELLSAGAQVLPPVATLGLKFIFSCLQDKQPDSSEVEVKEREEEETKPEATPASFPADENVRVGTKRKASAIVKSRDQADKFNLSFLERLLETTVF